RARRRRGAVDGPTVAGVDERERGPGSLSGVLEGAGGLRVGGVVRADGRQPVEAVEHFDDAAACGRVTVAHERSPTDSTRQTPARMSQNASTVAPSTRVERVSTMITAASMSSQPAIRRARRVMP